MPSVSAIDTILPGDLTPASVRSGADILIRQQDDDSVVCAETVSALLASGPYTAAFFGSTASVVSIASASSAVLNFESPTVIGEYAAGDWWLVADPENCIIPANGSYLAFFQTEIREGSVDGEVSVQLVADPGGANVVIRTVQGHSKGTGEKVSLSGFYFTAGTAAQTIGLRVTNSGLSSIDVAMIRTNIFIIKLA